MEAPPLKEVSPLKEGPPVEVLLVEVPSLKEAPPVEVPPQKEVGALSLEPPLDSS